MTCNTDGEYTWNINDPTLLNNILNAKNGEKFVSNVFNIGQIKWRIDITPNGMNEHNIDSFDIFLKLMQLPSSWKDITICKTIESPQTHSNYTKMVTYTDGKSVGWPDYTLTLKEIIQSQLKQIIIKINIKTLQIRLINDEIYYRIKFDFHCKQRLIWKFDGDRMNKLKLSNPGKMSSSNIYNDLWVIQVHPNGWHQKYGGRFIVTLELCALPPNVNRMDVEWTVSIKQLNVIKKRKLSQYSLSVLGKIMIPGSFDRFRSCEQFDIVMDVDILRLYDNDGKEIDASSIELNSLSTHIEQEIKQFIKSQKLKNHKLTLLLEEEKRDDIDIYNKHNNILSEINGLKEEIKKMKSNYNENIATKSDFKLTLFEVKINSLQNELNTKTQNLLDINQKNQQQIISLMNMYKDKGHKIQIIKDKLKGILDGDETNNDKNNEIETKTATSTMRKIKIGFATVCLVAAVGYIIHVFIEKNKDSNKSYRAKKRIRYSKT